jgi:hypothetical protein
VLELWARHERGLARETTQAARLAAV